MKNNITVVSIHDNAVERFQVRQTIKGFKGYELELDHVTAEAFEIAEEILNEEGGQGHFHEIAIAVQKDLNTSDHLEGFIARLREANGLRKGGGALTGFNGRDVKSIQPIGYIKAKVENRVIDIVKMYEDKERNRLNVEVSQFEHTLDEIKPLLNKAEDLNGVHYTFTALEENSYNKKLVATFNEMAKKMEANADNINSRTNKRNNRSGTYKRKDMRNMYLFKLDYELDLEGKLNEIDIKGNLYSSSYAITNPVEVETEYGVVTLHEVRNYGKTLIGLQNGEEVIVDQSDIFFKNASKIEDRYNREDELDWSPVDIDEIYMEIMEDEWYN